MHFLKTLLFEKVEPNSPLVNETDEKNIVRKF